MGFLYRPSYDPHSPVSLTPMAKLSWNGDAHVMLPTTTTTTTTTNTNNTISSPQPFYRFLFVSIIQYNTLLPAKRMIRIIVTSRISDSVLAIAWLPDAVHPAVLHEWHVAPSSRHRFSIGRYSDSAVSDSPPPGSSFSWKDQN
jgi:hypothetical protein